MLPALFLAACLPASAELVPLDRLRIGYSSFTLSNGLTVLVHEDHNVPIVTVNSWYHVGSKNELRGRTGFAHLFEHFFFEGSRNYPRSFREAMDEVGATNRNGTTSNDRTNFFEDVPVAALERTLFLESDRMGYVKLSSAALDQERGVVKNEKRERVDNQPYGRVWERLSEAMYPASHPYSWTPIGRMEDLDAASMDDVVSWYRAYYAPSNVVLALAGDVTPQRARQLVEKYYGSIPPGPPLPRPREWVPRLDSPIRETLEDRVPQARVYRAWHAPAWGQRDLALLELLASVLSGSKSSPLDRSLVYGSALATEVGAYLWDREIASTFIVEMTLRSGGDPRRAESEAEYVLARLLDSGPSKDELELARARLLAAFARGIEKLGGYPGGRSDVLAESMAYAGDPHAYMKRLEAISSATPAEVRDAGRRWLRAPHYTLTVEPFPSLSPAAAEADRKSAPPLGEAREPGFPELQRAGLENGLKIVLLERHATPLFAAALAVDAGFASDRERKGLASFALDLLDDGTRSRDVYRIADELDSSGAKLWSETRPDVSVLHLSGLAPSLERAFEVFAEVALAPAFPEPLVQLERKRRLAALAQKRADPQEAAERLLPGLAYPAGHPYAAPFDGQGDQDGVSRLTREDLARWHADWLRPGGATLVVAGDVTMDRLLPVARRLFGAWPAGSPPKKTVAAAAVPNAGKIFLLDKPGAPQSVIVALQPSRPPGGPEDVALEAVIMNLGGMSTSRLMRNLRVQKHWSYGAYGWLHPARGPRPLFIQAAVQADKTKESLSELEKELREAAERPIAGQEYETLMRYALLRLPGRFETLEAVKNAALNLVTFGYPDDWWRKYPGRLAALSQAELSAAAADAIKPARAVWLVVGDRGKLEGALRDLRLGEVIVLDADGRLPAAP